MKKDSSQIEADRKALEKLAASDSGDQWEAVETDEPTPEDADSRHRLVVRLLKANLAGNAVLARVMLRHDDWLNRIGAVWGAIKRTWPAGLLIVARPEIIPEWVWRLLKTLWETSGGQG